MVWIYNVVNIAFLCSVYINHSAIIVFCKIQWSNLKFLRVKECFHVILAGTNDLPEIVDLKFDHVFFTGNFQIQI